MHELSLCQNILDIIEQQCKKHHITQVTDIWLEVGVLSCIELSTLEFCFEMICNNTCAENCQLHLIPVSAQAWCKECQKQVEIQTYNDNCPICGSVYLQYQNNRNTLRIKELAFK